MPIKVVTGKSSLMMKQIESELSTQDCEQQFAMIKRIGPQLWGAEIF